MATPKAQEAYQKLYETLGSQKVNGDYAPVHHQLATHWARLVELLYAAGLRVSEALGLDREDISVTGGFVRVIGKGDKERLVPVGDVALAAVEAYLAERDRLAGAATGAATGLSAPTLPATQVEERVDGSERELGLASGEEGCRRPRADP